MVYGVWYYYEYTIRHMAYGVDVRMRMAMRSSSGTWYADINAHMLALGHLHAHGYGYEYGYGSRRGAHLGATRNVMQVRKGARHHVVDHHAFWQRRRRRASFEGDAKRSRREDDREAVDASAADRRG